MPQAARWQDPIGHSPTMSCLLKGLLIGAAIGIAAVAIIGTGGLAAAAIVGGMAAAGAGIGEVLSTMSWMPKEKTGVIAGPGSSNVFTNSRPAARAHLDFVQCSKHSNTPPLLATGSATVFINGQPAARVGDKTGCGGDISEGSSNVFIGGGTAPTDTIQPENLVPGWVHAALFVVGVGSAVLLAGPIVALCGLAGGVAGGVAGSWIGGKLWGDGSDGQKWSMLGGSILGGILGMKGGGVLASRGLPAPENATDAFLKGGIKANKEFDIARDREEITRLSSIGKLGDARELLKPFVDNGDVQGIIDRLDVTPPKNGGFLWSGNKAEAGRIAEMRGGVTLETTPGGKVIDDWTYLEKSMPWDKGGEQLWGEASSKYASQLSGDVSALQTPSRAASGGGYVYKNYELPKVEAGLDSGQITSLNIEPILSEPPTPP